MEQPVTIERSGLRAVTILALLPAVMSEGLSDNDKIGLIVGSTVGALVFIVLLLLLVILLCCRAKKRDPPFYDKDTAGRPVTDYRANVTPNNTSYVPPGIWTSKPSMAVSAPPYAARNHYTSSDVDPPSNQKRPEDNVYIPPSLIDPTAVPWYRRTVRQARKAFKRFPSVFQVKRPETKDVGVGTSSTLAPRRRTGATQTDMSRRVRDPTKGTTDAKPTQTQDVVEVDNAIRESGHATARIYCEYNEKRLSGADISTGRRTPTATVTVTRESSIIDVSGDYQEPKDFLSPSERPVMYRNTSTIEVAGSSGYVSRAVVREDSCDDGYAHPQDMVRMVQSDVNLSSTHPPDWTNTRMTSLQREIKSKKQYQPNPDSSLDKIDVGYTRQHYQYARGVFMRSASDVAKLQRPVPPRKPDKSTENKAANQQEKPRKFKSFFFGGSRSADNTSEAPNKRGPRQVHGSSAKKLSGERTGQMDTGAQRDGSRVSADYPVELNSQFVARVYSNPPSQSTPQTSLPPYVIQSDTHMPKYVASTSGGTSEESSKKERDLPPQTVSDKRLSEEDGLTTKSRTKSVRSEASVGSPDKSVVREAFEFLDDFEDNISVDEDVTRY